MRIDKQNRRSCIGVLLFLALLAAAILWMIFGGAPEDSTADDVQGMPTPAAAPGASGNPDGLGDRRS
jgi:hypothetical protein